MKGSLRFPLLLVCLAVLSLGRATGREAPLRIGVLFWHDSPNDTAALSGVKEGFRLAGMNAEFDVVDAGEDRPKADAALAGWERRKFDLVYAMGTSAALRAK